MEFQDRRLIKSLLVKNNIIPLDINDSCDPDIVADISTFNVHIPNESVDAIFCMEILEHVVDPFASIIEMSRILKNGGFLAISTPLNAKILGPVSDCWRFTGFGLRVF